MSEPWQATRETFSRGLDQLLPLLERHGFRPTGREFGKGSGGPFSEATFASDDRSITMWLRGESLSVIYRCGEVEADHLTYMRAAAGIGGGNEFPTYADDAVKSFGAVRRDLERFGRDFLSGSCERLREAAQAKDAAERENPMKRLADIEAALKAQ